MDWSIVINYRVKLAILSRQWDEALRLQKIAYDWHREKAGPALVVDRHEIDESARNDIRNYIVSIYYLARIQRETGDLGCIQSYKEAIEISEGCGFVPEAAGISMSLSNAYMDLTQIRDLDQAEYWCRRGLELYEESDGLCRGKCLYSLGDVAVERFIESLKTGRLEGKHLKAARELYNQSMSVLPLNASNELSAVHNALGNVCRYTGLFDEAHGQFLEAIRYKDEIGNIYEMAQALRNAAFNLQDAGRLFDALEYARSAQEKFEACGPTGAKEVQETQNLITKLEEALRSK